MPVRSDLISLVLIAVSLILIFTGCQSQGYDAGAVMYVPPNTKSERR